MLPIFTSYVVCVDQGIGSRNANLCEPTCTYVYFPVTTKLCERVDVHKMCIHNVGLFVHVCHDTTAASDDGMYHIAWPNYMPGHTYTKRIV